MNSRRPSTKNVQNTRNAALLRDLHRALIELSVLMNRPQRDDALLREAGVSLDRALFRPLVTVERLGPVGVMQLAERVGLDHTTVSRQVAKLEGLGLVERRAGASDGRVREVVITRKGRKVTALLDAARERMARQVFADWDRSDVATLAQLLTRLVDSLRDGPEDGTAAL